MTKLLAPEAEAYLQVTAQKRHRIRRHYRYYHADTLAFIRSQIERDSRVLIVGCDIEDTAQLPCARLVLVELDPDASLRSNGAPVHWVKSLDQAKAEAPYDYIVLPYTLQYLDNIQGFLNELQSLATPRTRLIVLQYNFLWAPLVHLAKRLALRSPLPDLNWINLQDVRAFLTLSGFQTVTSGARCLFPLGIPGIATFLNRFVAPMVPWLCQKSFLVARPWPVPPPGRLPSVTIVVPARNEAGNIAPLLDRLPELSPSQEVIFVEGHSKDPTWEEIQKQITTHPRRGAMALRAMRQTGVGKADAVRLGFAEATGDVLIILDADLSVQPEDLPYFFEPLAEGRAEFVNGSRLVYKMERYAMQVLNLFFNKVFGLLVSWQLGQSVKDTLCGTKALYRKDYQRLRRKNADEGMAEDPFGDFELLYGASRLALKISDVPVRYKERQYGSTNIRRFRHGWQLLRFCLASWGNMR